MNIINYIKNTCEFQYPFSNNVVFINYGATCHYAQPKALLRNEITMHKSYPICVTNGQCVLSSYNGELLNLPSINKTHKTAKAYPDNNNFSLISL